VHLTQVTHGAIDGTPNSFLSFIKLKNSESRNKAQYTHMQIKNVKITYSITRLKQYYGIRT